MTVLTFISVLAAVVVLAEGLNKLERADIFEGRHGLLPRLGALAWLVMPWRWRRLRVVTALKAMGWACLSIGAAGDLAAPFLNPAPPSLQDVAVIGGFALLIVRSRLKEVAQTSKGTS